MATAWIEHTVDSSMSFDNAADWEYDHRIVLVPLIEKYGLVE